MPYDLFMKFIDKMDESQVQEIAKEGPNIVMKLFKILGFSYDLDHVIYSYFEMAGKYCGWYEFTHQVKHAKYRLVFNANPNLKWTKFLVTYVRSILESLRIHVEEESVSDGVIVFEFSKRD